MAVLERFNELVGEFDESVTEFVDASLGTLFYVKPARRRGAEEMADAAD